MNANNESTRAIEDSISQPAGKERYVLRLYVTGMTPRSTEAFAAINSISEEELPARYDLEVIDIHERASFAKEEQIIAVPTLVKQLPSHLRRLIGNLAGRGRVPVGPDLRPGTDASTS